MVKYSIVIPVYNRPKEIEELLESLTLQDYTHFEVLIVEDGSTATCEDIAANYSDRLDLRYYFKKNSGQGFSRNYGFERARGDYFIVFDSDCLIPPHYLRAVDTALSYQWLDAYGGPDRADSSFTTVQKAISYSMTSLFTTGGIRGRKNHVGTFHPRSFNMGISRAVYEKTKGYIITRMGEDIEFSIRIIEHGFSTGLIENAFVYHKRRTSLSQFYKQLHFFGRARINISRYYPKELKPVHTFPAFFTLALGTYLISGLLSPALFYLGSVAFGTYTLLLFFDALVQNRSLSVALMSIAAAFTQLTAYGIGFMSESVRKLRRK